MKIKIDNSNLLSTDCLKTSGIGLLRARESNAKTYARTFDCIIQRGVGTHVWDSNGKEYLDMLACAGALPLGHNHPAIHDEVLAFLRSGQIQQGLDIATPEKVAFTEELMASLPVEFAQNVRLHFCGPTGSDAVEAAIKLFKTVTGRRAVVAFSGGYPLALIAYDAKYDKWAPGAHTGTFRGNQIAMVAGAATMRLLRDKNLVGHVQEMGARLQRGLKGLARDFDCIGDVRGRGLMFGAEIVSPEGKLDGSLAKAVKVECFHLGMIIETGGRHGAVLRFLPSLLIEAADIDLALQLLGQSITNVRASDHARQRPRRAEADSVFPSTHLQQNDF